MEYDMKKLNKIRIITIEGKDWFIGKDVVEALGYNLSGKHVASEYIKAHCEPEDYVLLDKNSPVNWGSVFDYKQLGQRGGYLVNESGLYSLVFGSDLPEAKKFKRWVTSEVLPQIRQTGGYIPIKEEDDELTIMSKAFLIAQKTIDKKQQLIEQQQQLIDEQQEVIETQKPKVEFADAVSESEDDEIDMGTMAKLLAKEGIKIGRNRLFDILIELKILMKNNLPYQKFIDNRYFRVIKCRKYSKWDNKPKFYEKTLIKGKGQIYVTKKVKEYFENKSEENNK